MCVLWFKQRSKAHDGACAAPGWQGSAGCGAVQVPVATAAAVGKQPPDCSGCGDDVVRGVSASQELWVLGGGDCRMREGCAWGPWMEG